MEILKGSPALPLRQLSDGTLSLENLANSSGKLGQAKAREIADSLANEIDVIGREGTMSGKRLTLSSGVGVAEMMKEETARITGGFSAAVVKCALVIATLVACLVILEVGLRFLGRYRGGTLEGYFAQYTIGYTLKKNTAKNVYWPTSSFSVYTDSLGFRAKEPGPSRLGAQPYYAILGSSEVFGNGLNYGETFIGVFAEFMQKRGVNVVNMAVPGYGFIELSLRFQHFAAPPAPTPQVVLIFLNPLIIGQYDACHDDVVVHLGHLFARNNWKLPLAKMMLSNLSTAFCFFRDGIRNAQLKYFSREDFGTSDYVRWYSSKHAIRTPEKTQHFLKCLKELEKYVRDLKAAPVYVFVPTVGGFMLNKLKAEGKIDGRLFDTEYFSNLVQKHCDAEGIQLVNLEPLLQRMYDKGEKLNFDLDSHFNAPTSRVMGEFIYEALKPEGETNSK